MFTRRSFSSACTTNGTDSRTSVAGLSVPNTPKSRFFENCSIAFESAKLRSPFESTQTFSSPSQMTAKISPHVPSRSRSARLAAPHDEYSLFKSEFSLNVPKRKLALRMPFGAV